MRFILFYSGIESFNYFTDCIVDELKSLQHETFILDLRDAANAKDHSLMDMENFMKSPVDAVIGYDQMPVTGSAFVDLWNENHIPVISIFMDPPYRFGKYNVDIPSSYLRFCCDVEHVTFCKRFYSSSIQNVYFLPHAGTIPKEAVPEFSKKKYDILFSGTYYSPELYLETIRNKYNDTIKSILFHIIDFMKMNPSFSFPSAVDRILSSENYNADDLTRLQIMEASEEADWHIRMYHRELVINSVLSSGHDLFLLGRGWNNHPHAYAKNFHIISDRIGFADSLAIMADAKINLNVMPWYKDGTHDRIFNTLLRDSMPLTDPSIYLKEYFEDRKSIRYYDLENLNGIPDIIDGVLKNPDETECIISSGKEIVLSQFTWKNIVKEIIDAAKAFC